MYEYGRDFNFLFLNVNKFVIGVENKSFFT
jgi:hypothetical protein